MQPCKRWFRSRAGWIGSSHYFQPQGPGSQAEEVDGNGTHVVDARVVCEVCSREFRRESDRKKT